MKENINVKKHSPSGTQILGWVLGGFSILGLIDELSLVSIYGKLKIWIEAYRYTMGAFQIVAQAA